MPGPDAFCGLRRGESPPPMADQSFDIIIIGAGPGGYVTAIRAAPARLQDGHRRARLPGRHLPQLGLHPDQGAAALGRGLPLPAARQGLRPDGREGRLRCQGGRGALAQGGRAAQRRRRLPDEEEQDRRDLGRGGHRGAGKVAVKASKSEAPKGALAPGTYQAKHIIVATGARPRVLPGHRARQEAGVDLLRGDGAASACRSRCW